MIRIFISEASVLSHLQIQERSLGSRYSLGMTILVGLSLASDRILIVIRRNEDVGIELVGFGRRLIRWEARDWSRRGIAALIPALVVVHVVSHVVVQLLDFPDAVFLHVLVLVGSLRPLRAPMQSSELLECAPASLGSQAVRRDINHGLELHVVEERSVLEFGKRVEIRAHAVLANPYTAQTNFERAVFREKIGGLVPLAFVHVVAVGALEIGDGDIVLRVLRLLGELRDLNFQRFDFGRDVFLVAGRLRRGGIFKSGAEEQKREQGYDRSDFHGGDASRTRTVSMLDAGGKEHVCATGAIQYRASGGAQWLAD